MTALDHWRWVRMNWKQVNFRKNGIVLVRKKTDIIILTGMWEIHQVIQKELEESGINMKMENLIRASIIGIWKGER